MKKKLLSWFFVVMMAMGLMTTAAFATTGVEPVVTEPTKVATKDELDRAIKNAADGAVIKLVADIDYTGTAALVINRAITLDLGDHTLTTNGTYGGLHLKSGCTLKNGTLAHKGTVTAIKAWNVAVIEDLVIDVAFKAEGKVIGGIVIQEGNNVRIDTIKNVTIKGEGLTNGIETYNCGTATENVIGSMENVTIDAKGTGMLISAPCGTATNCNIKGGVSGIELWIKGTYSATLDLDECTVEGGQQAIFAHDEFNSNPDIQNNGVLKLTMDEETKLKSENGKTLYVVIERAKNVDLTDVIEAEVDGTYYGTLAEAVEAANAKDGAVTITLLNDVTLSEKLTISGNVTIFGAYTITRDDDYTGTLFAVNEDATLTLDGGLTINGGNEYAFNSETYKADLANWEAPVPAAESTKWFTPEEGAPVATAYMITTSGTVNLNNVTIKDHYSTNGSGIVSASKGANVTLDGAQITHNASTAGSGLVVNASAGVWSREDELVTVTMNEGTVIDGNHVGGNHGVFKIYMGTYFTMNGGEIKNTTGWNSNGTAIGIYHAVFTMNGGTICSNSSVYGPNNGRNAAIYGHSNHLFTMNGGTICCNSGRAYGGVDSPYSETGYTGQTFIKGGSILNNSSIGGWSTPDVAGGATLTISGGTYTQDVTKWLDSGYGLIYNAQTNEYTVTKSAIAEIDGTIYSSLADAARYAKNGDTIKLLASYKAFETVVLDKNITLDLNGNHILGSDAVNPIIRVLANVTVTGNGMIDSANSGDGYCFIVGNGEGALGNLTIENGTFKGTTTAVSVTKGTATILDGDFRVKPYVASEGAEENYNFLLNCIDANYKDGSAKIVVKGGNFTKFNPADNAAEGAGTNFVAQGYTTVESSENVWTVLAPSSNDNYDDDYDYDPTYHIEIAKDIDNGSVSTRVKYASSGDTVSITVTPGEGYELDELTVTDSKGNEIEVTYKNGKYTFKMPARKVTIHAAFVSAAEMPFVDVDADDWYYDAVQYAYDNDIMAGVGGSKFDPNAELTRAMVAQVLYNLDEDRYITSANQFVDVIAGEWYVDAINWAVSEGIFAGYGNGKFGTLDSVTREQLAMILYNYAVSKGYTISGSITLGMYADADKTSGWAVGAMEWAVANGILLSNDGLLTPTAPASRAEVAYAMMMFCENIMG